ncbi:MAG: redoxin domain-containing protein [Acidimicrobiia bacterium]
MTIGDKAPDFELRRTFEETVRLGDLLERGPVVLAFYVFDFGHV